MGKFKYEVEQRRNVLVFRSFSDFGAWARSQGLSRWGQR